jgi:hypothetical protein
MRRRVMDGENMAPPLAATRIVATQLVLGRVLDQKAARSRQQRVYTYSSRSNVVEPLQDNRLARPGNFSGRCPSNKA